MYSQQGVISKAFKGKPFNTKYGQKRTDSFTLQGDDNTWYKMPFLDSGAQCCIQAGLNISFQFEQEHWNSGSGSGVNNNLTKESVAAIQQSAATPPPASYTAPNNNNNQQPAATPPPASVQSKPEKGFLGVTVGMAIKETVALCCAGKIEVSDIPMKAYELCQLSKVLEEGKKPSVDTAPEQTNHRSPTPPEPQASEDFHDDIPF